MMAWLEARAWQLAAIAAGALVVALSVMLFVNDVQLNKVQGERDQLHDAIHNEATGYVVRLNTCRRNVDDLEASVKRQSDEIERMERETEQRVANAEAAVASAKVATENANRRLARFLSESPMGSTVCERVEDVDRRFLELLK